MSRWPAWSHIAEPSSLARYIRPDIVGAILGDLPEPSPTLPITDLQQMYEQFDELDIAYHYEPSGNLDGQRIRAPDEVLITPRHATCLDLAVVFSAACERAGIQSVIAVVSGFEDSSDHAFVLASTERPERIRRPRDSVLNDPPRAALENDVQASREVPGSIIAIDVARLAVGYRRGVWPAGFWGAVAAGASLLDQIRGSQRAWRVGIDIAAGYSPDRVLDPGDFPRTPVLISPYLPVRSSESPLAALRAREGRNPFISRPEYEDLLYWCNTETSDDTVVVYGLGGVGKTRLAAELCATQQRQGWFTGFLKDGANAADLEWLATVESPLLTWLTTRRACRQFHLSGSWS